MQTTARLDLSIWRNDDVYELPIRVIGPDLTGVAMRAQFRLGPDVPGAALIDLALVTNGNAQGIRLAGVTTVAGVSTNDVRVRLNKSTRQALPYSGELGDAALLAWAFQIAGVTRIVGQAAVLAHVMDSDAAPTNRPWGLGQAGVSLPAGGATLTIAADNVVELRIDGADLVGRQVATATDAAVAAIAAKGGAEAAAAGVAGVAVSISRTGADTATAFADVGGTPVAAFPRGRFGVADGTFPIEASASRAGFAAQRYEQFGQLTPARRYFLADCGENAQGRQVFFKRLAARWDESAGYSSCRMASVVAYDDGSGLILYSQFLADRSALPGSGSEDGQRLMTRTYSISYANGAPVDVTFGAPVEIDTPASQQTQGGKTFHPVALLLRSGPNAGKVLVVYNRLDTGIQARPGASVDLVYRLLNKDGSSAGARQMIWSGTATIADTGLTPGGNERGAFLAPGNCIIQLPPSHPTSPNRILVAAAILVNSEDQAMGCVYSDDNGATWSKGAFAIANAAADGGATYVQTEVSVSVRLDGTVVMLARGDRYNFTTYMLQRGRGLYTSTNGGASFTYQGWKTDIDIGNVAGGLINTSFSAATGFSKLLASGSVAAGAGVRNEHRFFLSYDGGASWQGRAALFPAMQGIGYSSITRLPNGLFALVYDDFSALRGFNKNGNVGFALVNDAAILSRATMIGA